MDASAEPYELLRGAVCGPQRLGVLATQGPEHPYASLVAVCAGDDLRHLYFTTTRATRKFQFLSAAPRVALLVDSRSDDDLDFHGAVAATAVCTARELHGDDRAAQLPAYLRRHPHLRPSRSSTSALIELAVDTYYIVSRFQNVTELHLR